jgi:hypothetical protein
MEPFRDLIERMQATLKVKEPASNYDMPIRNRKRAEEQAIRDAEAAKAAEEAAAKQSEPKKKEKAKASTKA